MLTDTVKDNGIIFDEKEIRQLVDVVVKECKDSNVSHNCSTDDVTITYLEMKALLEKQPGLAAAIGTRDVHKHVDASVETRNHDKHYLFPISNFLAVSSAWRNGLYQDRRRVGPTSAARYRRS